MANIDTTELPDKSDPDFKDIRNIIASEVEKQLLQNKNIIHNEAEKYLLQSIDFIKNEVDKQIQRSNDLIKSESNNELSKNKHILHDAINGIKKKNDEQLNNKIKEYELITSKLNSLHKEFIEKYNIQLNTSSENISNITNKINELNKQAESILKKSSEGTLSSSFLKEKRKHQLEIASTFILFTFCITTMISIPLILYEFNILSSIEEWIKNPILILFAFIKVFALEWPLIWLGNILSKRLQIQERICEEYTFKYSVSLAYAALRNEIQIMHPDIHDLSEHKELKSFTEKMATAIFVNPSTFFNKKIDTNSPINEIVELINKIGADKIQNALKQIEKP